MESQKKFIGLIGLGYWGKNIFRNLNELNVLNTACDVNTDIIEDYKRRFPQINCASSLESVWSDKDIKAVVIATPAATHFELAKTALLEGRDVFVEKPLALTEIKGLELVELAKKTKKILMVGHILQYHPAIIKLKSMILKGELGKIRYIYSNRLNIGKLRIEENILWSFAPHDISVILMLLDEEPIKISAFGGDYINAGINDVTLTTLEFKNGVRGHMFVSWLHPYKEQKMIVVGSKAMVVFDDLTKGKLFLYPHTIEWKDGKIPVAQKADFKLIPVYDAEPLKLELEHFIECVEQRKNPRTDGFEGLRVLKVLEGAEKAFFNRGKIAVQSDKSDNKFFVHESCFVDNNVMIGEGTKIWHFSHILNNSKIGKDCVIGQNVSIGPDAIIGNKCKIQNNVSVYKGVTIEDEVFCGPACVFTNVYNPRSFIERKNEFRKTLVKRGATVGANSTIVCGVTIGQYAFVGAGAVVNKDIPNHALVVGNPARPVGYVCKCGTTLNFVDTHSKCAYCGNEYSNDAKGIKIITQNKQATEIKSWT